MLLDLFKKYLFSEKLESNTFCVMFFITRFSDFFQKQNRKIIEKPKKNVLQKITFSKKTSIFQNFRSRFVSIFFSKKKSKKILFSRSKFLKNRYFFEKVIF